MRSPCRCGPGCFPEWLRRILSVRFNSACRDHDDAYGDAVLPQKVIDKKFLADMLRLAGWNPFWILVAYFYYAVARIFGHWRYPKRPSSNQ